MEVTEDTFEVIFQGVPYLVRKSMQGVPQKITQKSLAMCTQGFLGKGKEALSPVNLGLRGWFADVKWKGSS